MDHAFKEPELVRGQRLATKMWNVMRMVGSACKERPAKPASVMPIDAWVLSRFGRLVHEVEARCEEYQFDKATSLLEDFLWHEFADHYLELAKNRVYSGDDRGAKYALYTVGLGLLKMMSVIFPHAAEDAYQLVFKQFEEPVSIHVSAWPTAPEADEAAERKGDAVKEVTAAVRAWKASKGLSLNAGIKRIEVVGADASALLGGSEQDVAATVKAKEVAVLATVDLKETITGLKPVHAKIGPVFKRDVKEIVEFLTSYAPGSSVPAEGIDVRLKDGPDHQARAGVLSGPEDHDLGTRQPRPCLGRVPDRARVPVTAKEGQGPRSVSSGTRWRTPRQLIIRPRRLHD
jgi:valyl-tRNA synthetase